MEAIDKTELELQWTNHRCKGVPNWDDYRSTHRIYIYEGLGLVYWEARGGVPRILNTYTVRDIALFFDTGLRIGLQAQNGLVLKVGANPKELLDGVFMWTPAFADVRFAPLRFADPDGSRRVTAPLVLKTRKNPKEGPVEGVRYLSTLKEFRAFWPDII